MANSLPDNPLGGFFGGQPSAPRSLPTNPIHASLTPAPGNLTSIATRIATSAHLDPGFVKQLQARAKADPSFQTRLNAEVARVSKGIESKQNSSPLALVGKAVEGTVNPIEWVKGAVQGAGQVEQGVKKIVHGNVKGGLGEAGLGAVGVAGILPFAKPLGFLRGAVRTADEAAAHVAEASAAAKAQGFGQTVAQKAATVLLRPGEVTPETAGQLGASVRQALKNAPETRTAQNALYSAERGKRFSQASEAMKANEGVASYHAALSKLKGELPKLDFQGFKQLDGEALHQMLNVIKDHPGIQTGEKVTAQRSLLRAVGEGKVPTAGEQRILEKVFGKEVVRQVTDASSFYRKYKNLALEIANVPRAFMASADLSAPFRQGLVAGVSHPKLFFKNFMPMLKSFGSEQAFQASMHDIYARPTFALMQKAKLSLTDIGTDAHSTVALGDREEQFMSNLAEQLNLRNVPGLKKLGKAGTGPGDVIRASDRAYVGFLNKMRADVFDSLVHAAATEGRDLNDPRLLQDIAKFVNSATGRGSLGALQKHAATMNTLFFSPRLLMSRFNFLNPAYYLSLDPFARRQALNAAFDLVGTMGVVLYLSKLAGAKVGTDPTSADFAKIRIGNTRLDVAGGFQQWVRLISELKEGKITSSTTGQSMKLSSGIGKVSRGDIALRFAISKLAPIPSFVTQESGLSQASFGPKTTLRQQLTQRMIPLLLQDANDLRTTPGAFGGKPSLGKAVAGYGLGVFGVGEQTYAPSVSGSSNNGWGGSSGSNAGWGSSSSNSGWGG